MLTGSNAWVSTKAFQKTRKNDARIHISHDGYDLRVRYIGMPKKTGRPPKGKKQRPTILMTNLKKRDWSLRQVGLLYKSRWGIETAFREMKHVLSMNRIHARKSEGVRQEVACACVIMVLIATLELIALHNSNKEIDGPFNKNKYRANRISIIKLIQIITRELFSRRKIYAIWKQLMRVGKRARPVKKGRSFERRCKSVDGIWKQKQRRR